MTGITLLRKLYIIFTVNSDELDKMSQKAKMTLEDYIAQTVKALTRQNVGNMMFTYQVQESKAAKGKQFTWKKHLPTESLKVLPISYLLSKYLFMKVHDL